MKAIFTFSLLLIFYGAFSQISVDGSTTNLQVTNNAPAVVVDNALVVSTPSTINGFTVTITNYAAGDVLAYTGSLPAGVTAVVSAGTLAFSGVASAANYQALLRTVTFSSTSSQTTNRVINFTAGDGTLWPFNGHFYKRVSTSVSWTTAKTNAAGLNYFGIPGYLATITTDAENNFLWSSGLKGWIGASDEYTQINAATSGSFANQTATEGRWYWVTGPEKGQQFSNGATVITGKYAKWNSGEPNNAGSTEHYAENSYANNGNWNDAPNTNNNAYVVEFGSTGVAADIQHSRTVNMVGTQVKATTSAQPYELQAPAITVDPNIVVYSTLNFTNARATISQNFNPGDVLSYTGSLPGEFSGSYNSTTGVLTFSTTGTVTAAEWQNLFRTVQFSSTSNVIGDRKVTFSLGNLVAFNNGHFYQYVATSSNWTTAKASAAASNYQGLQGYLATITSQEENDFIKQTLAATAWIGASDEYTQINAATSGSFASQTATEGNWYWVTGPEKGLQMTTGNAPAGGQPPVFGTTYNNWNSGEPNNSGGEHFAQIYATAGNLGKWNDLNNSNSLGYVVEYGGLSGDPLLYLSASRTLAINSILPITGLKFEASATTAGVQLRWKTETEVNSQYFSVLHSTDGVHFNKVTSVAAAGNSETTQAYQWLHRQPATGINYYRLQQFDRDGRYSFSDIVKVTVSNTMALLTPSPAAATITITYPYNGKKAVLFIINASGFTVAKSTIVQNQTTVNVKSLPAGVYFVQITDGQNIQKLRFVKK